MKLLLLFLIVGAVLIIDYFAEPALEPADEAATPSSIFFRFIIGYCPCRRLLSEPGYSASREQAMADFKAGWGLG